MERPEEVPTEDISSLFSVKKKTGKKIKISLDDRDKPEIKDTVEIIKKTTTTISSLTETTETTKLDYSYNESTTDIKSVNKDLATTINEYDTEHDRDHLARRKEALQRSKDLATNRQLDTTYRGLKGYQQFLMQGDTAKANAGSDKNRVAGPVRAAANLRVTCRFDYKPDLCKDYNETGFCGFGDSCIFLHDRTEHKSSYQLEQEWEADQKRKQLEAENSEALVKESKTVAKPTECAVCFKAFSRPVKTKCGHYFCESCVLRLSKCPTCKSALLGSFKPASKELAQ